MFYRGSLQTNLFKNSKDTDRFESKSAAFVHFTCISAKFQLFKQVELHPYHLVGNFDEWKTNQRDFIIWIISSVHCSPIMWSVILTTFGWHVLDMSDMGCGWFSQSTVCVALHVETCGWFTRSRAGLRFLLWLDRDLVALNSTAIAQSAKIN